MAIENVLFDADGVIQETMPDWLDHWKRMIPDPSEADGFVSDIFAAEYPHLLGEKGFEDSLKRVLQKWENEVPLADVLYAWTLINPSEQILAIVGNVRANGIRVALATISNSSGINTCSRRCVTISTLMRFSCHARCMLPNHQLAILKKS